MQHVSAAVGHHQAKLEQSLGILNVRTRETKRVLLSAVARISFIRHI